VTASPKIRRELRPGELGEIVSMHGRVYASEYGLDSSMEAFVGSSVVRAALRGWPAEQGGVWVVESDGRLAGCVGYTDEGEGTAVLRWFVLDPALRGRGLGRRLIAELMEEVRAAGFDRVRLETFSDLTAAARIYREHGFRVTESETGPRWGREPITYQHYELALRDHGPGDRGTRAAASAG
jgi:ribosomal protein S18 acetylase RimI-like enzyme